MIIMLGESPCGPDINSLLQSTWTCHLAYIERSACRLRSMGLWIAYVVILGTCLKPRNPGKFQRKLIQVTIFSDFRRGPIRLGDRVTGQWKWTEEVPRRTSLTPLASPCFILRLIGLELEGLLDYQGSTGIISIVQWNLCPVLFGVDFEGLPQSDFWWTSKVTPKGPESNFLTWNTS